MDETMTKKRVCNRPAGTAREWGKENRNQRGRRSRKTWAEEEEKLVKFLLNSSETRGGQGCIGCGGRYATNE